MNSILENKANSLHKNCPGEVSKNYTNKPNRYGVFKCHDSFLNRIKSHKFTTHEEDEKSGAERCDALVPRVILEYIL